MLAKMSRYVKTFNDKDENKNKKLMRFRIDDEELVEKYKIISTKIEELQMNELNVSPVYDNRYIKTKIKTYGDNVYTNFCSVNVLEDGVECEYFKIMSIDSLLVYESKYYLQVYLAYEIHI